MTHREYLGWMEYLRVEANTPSVTQHYLMQLTARVALGPVREGTAVRDEMFRIEFVAPEEVRPTDPECESAAQAEYDRNRTELAKGRWLAVLGGAAKRVEANRGG